MNLPTFLKKPLIAGVIGAATIAVPVSALYVAGATRAVATTPAPAAATTAPPTAVPSVMLPDFSSMVQKYGPAVVNIAVVTKVSASYQGDDDGDDDDDDDNGNGGGNGNSPFGPNSPFAPFFRGLPFQFQNPQQQPMRGEGSGFIIRPDGLILTNAHVVNGASEVTVRLTDRREYTAKVIGVDTKSDIAVIKISAKDLPTVKHRRLARPEGRGVGARDRRAVRLREQRHRGHRQRQGAHPADSGYVPFIQTDVPINPGNSGGPLFNMQGEVVGINSQIYSRSGGYMGVSFSIPIDVAMQVEQQLQTSGHVTRGKLGVVIQNVNQGLADSFGLPQPEGALVSSVEKGGPAEKAGVEPGDVILKLNGEPLKDSTELPVQIASVSPGTSVNLEIWRNHATRNLSVKLGEMSDTRTAASGRAHAGEGGKLGLAVRPLTPEEQRQANMKGGLVVERASGPAADAGIQPGDVVLAANGAPVTSADELKSAVEKSKGHVALLIQRGDAQIFVPVRVG